jgi:transposase-like protein
MSGSRTTRPGGAGERGGDVERTLGRRDRLCNAQRYERTETRRDTRAAHYERKLQTKAGEVKLRIPKLRMRTSLRHCGARGFRPLRSRI